jgi:nucleotide-binding universal stress UspA family protein
MRFHTILLPTDYENVSEEALTCATDLAQEYGARLILLHVVETLGPEGVTYGEAVSLPQPEGYRRRLFNELHRVRVPNPKIPVDYMLAEGEPAAAIVRAAAEKQCDLIVVGSHGRSGLRRWLEGSVAEHVVRWAHCPVLVVKGSGAATLTARNEATDLHPRDLSERSD